jgi:hypothetical protein
LGIPSWHHDVVEHCVGQPPLPPPVAETVSDVLATRQPPVPPPPPCELVLVAVLAPPPCAPVVVVVAPPPPCVPVLVVVAPPPPCPPVPGAPAEPPVPPLLVELPGPAAPPPAPLVEPAASGFTSSKLVTTKQDDPNATTRALAPWTSHLCRGARSPMDVVLPGYASLVLAQGAAARVARTSACGAVWYRSGQGA